MVLYDTRVGEEVNLGPLTLVAKGDRIPAHTRREGPPAFPAREVETIAQWGSHLGL